MTEELRLVRLPARRLEAAVASPASVPDAPPRARLDVFANWDDVLRVLEGHSDPSGSALSRAVHGSTQGDNIGWSYPEDVAGIARDLAAGLEHELCRHEASGPHGSRTEVEQQRVDWALEWYGHIRDFYGRAAKKHQAVVCVFR